MKTHAISSFICTSTVFFVVLTPAHSQTAWDGNGDVNASGNWNTANLWDTDAIPGVPAAATNVQLNDVTSSTRTITHDATVDPAISDIRTLAMTQTTVGAVNELTIAKNLILRMTSSGTQTVFNQTLGVGVSTAGLVVNVNTGGQLQIDYTQGGTKVLVNAGSMNFNGGNILWSATQQNGKTLTNNGIINVTASSSATATNSGATGAHGAYLLTNSAGAQLNVDAGTFRIGNTSTGNRTGSVTLSNSGTAKLAVGTTLRFSNTGSTTASDNELSQLTNTSTGTFTAGSASSAAGAAIIEFESAAGTQGTAPKNATISNSGIFSVYGQSSIVGTRTGGVGTASVNVNNNAGGTMTLAGNASGITIGTTNTGDIRYNATLSNAGTMNVSVIDGAATGRTTLGVLSTNAGARGSVTAANGATGILNISPDATLRLLARSSGSAAANGGLGTQINTFTNAAGGIVNLGTSGVTTSGGTFLQTFTSNGTPTSGAVTFSNSGTVNAYGTSVIELAATSVNTALLNTQTFTNQSGANLNLSDTARLGNTTKITAFNNAGTLTKLNAGTAEIRSAAGGTNTNTGDITVTAGTLEFSLGLSSSTGTIAVASGAQLTAGGSGLNLTSGTLTGNGAINSSTTIAGTLSPGPSPGNLTFNNGLNLSGIYKWELGALSTNPSDYDRVTVTAGDVNIAGASLFMDLGLLAPSGDPFWSTDRIWAGIVNLTGANSLLGTFTITNDQTPWASLGGFSTTYTDNDVNLVWTAVPEPSGALLAGGLGFLAILRRRRA